MSEPFKMKGHALPGPNQRSALKAIPGEGGVFDHFNEIARLSTLPMGRKKTSGQIPVGSSIEGNERPQETQAYVDTGMDDSGIDTTAAGDDTAKKKVDVEVTVNDKKI